MTADQELPEETREKIQLLISIEAAARLRVAAAIRNVKPGELLTELIEGNLPPLPGDSR